MATIKSLYIYSVQSGILLGYVNPTWKTVNGTKRVYIPTSKKTYTVSQKPGKVYFNKRTQELRVWFEVIDSNKAIKALSNYILDDISKEIRTSSYFVDRVTQEREKFLKSNK